MELFFSQPIKPIPLARWPFGLFAWVRFEIAFVWLRQVKCAVWRNDVQRYIYMAIIRTAMRQHVRVLEVGFLSVLDHGQILSGAMI